jgi:hypothetical protein
MTLHPSPVCLASYSPPGLLQASDLRPSHLRSEAAEGQAVGVGDTVKLGIGKFYTLLIVMAKTIGS